jgi:hypothetical protein
MLLMDQSWAMLRNCVLQGMVPFISVLKLCLVDSLAMQSGVCAACVRASHAKARCQFAFFIPHMQGTTSLFLSYLDILLVLPGCVSGWLMIFGCDD